MIPRTAAKKVLDYLGLFPAVALVGARQVGKTTLAQSITNQLGKPVRYFDLERLEDYKLLTTDRAFCR
jgi:uncharacterized protein